MKMKRILALLALLLCLPVWAMAAEVASGTSGVNVHWSLDDEGTLTISGTGDMERYESGYWGGYIDILKIKKVVIGDGITSIDKEQFRYHGNLQSVEIGKNVVSIGPYAFYDCSALESVVFQGDKVNSVGQAAFYGCSSLKSITLPSGLTCIEGFGLSGLESIIIPNGVTTIGTSAFVACQSLKSIIIPDDVTTIGNQAFYECTALKSITLPSGLTRIGDLTFCYSGLESITIPGSVESIGQDAFYGCTNLTSVNVLCSWHTKPLYDFDDGVTLDFPGEWSKWTVTEPATTKKAGTEQRECGGCGHIETREIPILPVLPQTGDESNVMLWSAFACLSLFAMAILAYKKKNA